MRRVGLIISYNKRINENLRNGNTELAARWYTRLRLLEIFTLCRKELTGFQLYKKSCSEATPQLR